MANPSDSSLPENSPERGKHGENGQSAKSLGFSPDGLHLPWTMDTLGNARHHHIMPGTSCVADLKRHAIDRKGGILGQPLEGADDRPGAVIFDQRKSRADGGRET